MMKKVQRIKQTIQTKNKEKIQKYRKDTKCFTCEVKTWFSSITISNEIKIRVKDMKKIISM